MRTATGVLAAILFLFAAVQINDADFVFWGSAYGIAAIWCGLAALRPAILKRAPIGILLSACIIVALVGMYAFWPQDAYWWQSDVWWESEAAREGMGLMIVAASLLWVGFVRIRLATSI